MNLTDHPFMDTEKYPFNYEQHKGRLVDTTNNVYVDYEVHSPLHYWVKSGFGASPDAKFGLFKGMPWAVEKHLDELSYSVKIGTPCKDIGIVAVSKANLKEFNRIHNLCLRHCYDYDEIHLDFKKKKHPSDNRDNIQQQDVMLDGYVSRLKDIDWSYNLSNRSSGDVLAYRLEKRVGSGTVTIKNLDSAVPDKTVSYSLLDTVKHLNMMLYFSEEKDKQSFIDKHSCIVRFEDDGIMAPAKGQAPFNACKNFRIIKNTEDTFFGLIR